MPNSFLLDSSLIIFGTKIWIGSVARLISSFHMSRFLISHFHEFLFVFHVFWENVDFDINDNVKMFNIFLIIFLIHWTMSRNLIFTNAIKDFNLLLFFAQYSLGIITWKWSVPIPLARRNVALSTNWKEDRFVDRSNLKIWIKI